MCIRDRDEAGFEAEDGTEAETGFEAEDADETGAVAEWDEAA